MTINYQKLEKNIYKKKSLTQEYDLKLKQYGVCKVFRFFYKFISDEKKRKLIKNQ